MLKSSEINSLGICLELVLLEGKLHCPQRHACCRHAIGAQVRSIVVIRPYARCCVRCRYTGGFFFARARSQFARDSYLNFSLFTTKILMKINVFAPCVDSLMTLVGDCS
jgi:hypothetical protein